MRPIKTFHNTIHHAGKALIRSDVTRADARGRAVTLLNKTVWILDDQFPYAFIVGK